MVAQRIRGVFSLRGDISRGEIGAAQRLEFAGLFRTLLCAGLTVTDALAVIAEEVDDSRVAETVHRTLDFVRQGKSLSQACAQSPQAFDTLFLATLEAGELAGALPTALTGYTAYLARQIEFTKRVRQALTYPIFLLATLGAILGLMFVFVLPRFTQMYADLGVELPWATRVLVALVEHWFGVAMLVAGLIFATRFGVRRLHASPQYALWLAKLKERIPIVGPLWVHLRVVTFANAMGMLMASGLPALSALKTFHDSAADPDVRRRVDVAIERVRAGKSLSAALRAAEIMPASALAMLRVGEDGGHVSGMLEDISKLYQERVNGVVAKLVTIIEPMLILLMGLLVGAVLIAMYLPIFSVMEVVP
ncbi:MAG: type II secretion system F family protein [Pseudomonadota bacterium]